MSGTLMLLRAYDTAVAPTDKLPTDDFSPVLFGLFGEVGSIMTTAKKPYREKDAYPDYANSLVEEFGDAFWYFAALCRRCHVDLEAVFSELQQDGRDHRIAATDLPEAPLATLTASAPSAQMNVALLRLGNIVGQLLSKATPKKITVVDLRDFAKHYLQALVASEVPFSLALDRNKQKVLGKFARYDPAELPTFDSEFPVDEQLPQHFEIHIVQRPNGKAYLKCNGVFLGDPLTDNIADPDGYRFHDVFHLAHAAVLHWSPVFRALIKHKRKTDPKVDETQDGGRAIAIEEGLTAWIFSRAKSANMFEGRCSLSFDLLKIIQQFVTGYEVEKCPLKLWEDAILQGYEVFRKVRENGCGIVVGDRARRMVSFKPLR